MARYSLDFVAASNQYTSLANGGIFSSTTLTLGFWFKLSALGVLQFIYCQDGYLSVRVTSGNVLDMGWDGSNVDNGTTVLTTGVWYNVVAVANAGTQVVYLNGVSEITSSRAVDTTHHSVGNFGQSTSSSFFFSGKLWDIFATSTALSSTQAANIYNGTLNPNTLGSLLGLWELTEGPGNTTTVDGSGNSDTMTLHGGIVWDGDAPFNPIGAPFDAASNSGYQSASSSYTWMHTCTGANGFLAVDVEIFSVPGTTVTGVTYNSVSLSLIGAQNVVSGTGRVECWGLVAPATGTHTIAVTLSASVASAGTAASYYNVTPSTPTEAFAGNSGINSGVATPATVNITTVADKDTVHSAVAAGQSSAVTAHTGQISRNIVFGTLGNGANSDEGLVPASTVVTMQWDNIAITAAWAIAGYGLVPYSVPANPQPGYEDATNMMLEHYW